MIMKTKRAIVKRFMKGESIEELCYALVLGPYRENQRQFFTQQVIRDYMNGKFSLDAKDTMKIINTVLKRRS